jgi:hypothetical protein
MDAVDLAAIAAAGTAAASAVIAVWSVRKALREQSYFEYTKRYHDILAMLPADFFGRPPGPEAIKERDDWRQAAHLYVDLCSEEVKLRLRRQVPRRVWRDWEEGIARGMKSEGIEQSRAASSWGQSYDVLGAYLNGGLRAAGREYRKSSHKTRPS